MSACFMTRSVLTIPKDLRAVGVTKKPSFRRAKGASRKNDRMVMMENRLMLSREPCKSSIATQKNVLKKVWRRLRRYARRLFIFNGLLPLPQECAFP